VTGNVLYVPTTGTLGVTFPYTITSKAGTLQNNFSSTDFNLFPSPFISFGLSAQIPSKKRHFLDLGFGIGGRENDKNIAYFFAGYGQKIFSKNKFNIKASIDAAYYEFSNALGGIDNMKKNISLLGTIEDSTFTVHHSRSQPSIVYANALYIQYLQKDYILIPKVGFEYGPSEGKRRFVGFTISYLIPIYEKGTIRLEQEGATGQTAGGASFPLATNGLSLTYNNTPITTTPYHFNGWQFSFKMGWVIGKPPATTAPRTEH
jgi:hypothetical protein